MAEQDQYLDEIQQEEPQHYPQQNRRSRRRVDPFQRFRNQESDDEEDDDQLELMEVKYVKPGVYTKLIKRKPSQNDQDDF